MNALADKPRSLAVKASWTALGLAFGGAAVFLIGQATNQISPFEHSPRGLLTGFVPRAGLYVLSAGEALISQPSEVRTQPRDGGQPTE